MYYIVRRKKNILKVINLRTESVIVMNTKQEGLGIINTKCIITLLGIVEHRIDETDMKNKLDNDFDDNSE